MSVIPSRRHLKERVKQITIVLSYILEWGMVWSSSGCSLLYISLWITGWALKWQNCLQIICVWVLDSQDSGQPQVTLRIYTLVFGHCLLCSLLYISPRNPGRSFKTTKLSAHYVSESADSRDSGQPRVTLRGEYLDERERKGVLSKI